MGFWSVFPDYIKKTALFKKKPDRESLKDALGLDAREEGTDGKL